MENIIRVIELVQKDKQIRFRGKYRFNNKKQKYKKLRLKYTKK